MVAAAKNYVFPTVLEFPLYNNVLRVNMRGEWSLIAANGGVVAMALGDFGTNAKFAPISAGSIKVIPFHNDAHVCPFRFRLLLFIHHLPTSTS